MLSQAVAAATVLVYHVANACRLASTGRHLDAAMRRARCRDALRYRWANTSGIRPLAARRGRSSDRRLARGIARGAARSSGGCSSSSGSTRPLPTGLDWPQSARRSSLFGAHLVLLTVAAAAVAAPWIASLGSGMTVAAWPTLPRLIAILVTTIFSQAGLWAEAYLITGMAMDAIHGKCTFPSVGRRPSHPRHAERNGLQRDVHGQLASPRCTRGGLLPPIACPQPARIAATLFGALAFPLVKTIIETFDGSQAFFRRVRRSYESPVLYFRGAVVGMGLGTGLFLAMAEKDLTTRVWFGIGVGALAFAGVDLLRDSLNAARGRGRIEAVAVLCRTRALGGFIGAAIGFYLDASQVSVVVAKFHRYLAAGLPPESFDVYPLVSKWGHLHLGSSRAG